jgi:hypothetical protein
LGTTLRMNEREGARGEPARGIPGTGGLFSAIDIPISAAEIRISAIEIRISAIEIRISTIEIRISAAEIRISAIEIRISAAEIRISTIEIRISAAGNMLFEPGSGLDALYGVVDTESTLYMGVINSERAEKRDRFTKGPFYSFSALYNPWTPAKPYKRRVCLGPRSGSRSVIRCGRRVAHTGAGSSFCASCGMWFRAGGEPAHFRSTYRYIKLNQVSKTASFGGCSYAEAQNSRV